MPSQISRTEIEEIVETIKRFAAPVSADELNRTLRRKLEIRTLQRRLALLVKQHRVMSEGDGPARRYRAREDATFYGNIVSARGHVLEPKNEFKIPISSAGEEIVRAIRRPSHLRKPVGYDREFLESYRPNKTYYLSVEMRSRLREMGGGQGVKLPPGTYLKKVFDRVMIDLSWNSSRLEGNTYSLLETERLLNLGEMAEGKDFREAQMILNHKAAIEMLVDQSDELGYNRYTILNLHALLSDFLLKDRADGGRLRYEPIGIRGTVYHPVNEPQVIEECFDRILEAAESILDPFEQAFFAMVHLPYLQPFVDVNKRVSRMAANIPLVRNNLCPLTFVDVPVQTYMESMIGVYELNRVELLRDVFVWAYESSCNRYSQVRQVLGDPDPFRMRYRAMLKELAAEIVRGQLDKTGAVRMIRTRAEVVAPADKDRFIEVMEIELMSLHEGNIARYRLKPAEYWEWRKQWK